MHEQEPYRLNTDGLPTEVSVEDKELALAFQRGERGADRGIYERYAARVYRICRRMLFNHDDAEEAVQETFLRTYQGLAKFNGRYHLGAWITRIASNVCLDHIRSRSRKPSHCSLDAVGESAENEPRHDLDPQDVLVRNGESARVRHMLAALPPAHRAAIVLRDFEGLSYADIAIALDMTESQVKALLHRARKGFKRSWLSSVAHGLLPVGLLGRLRRLVNSGKEPASNAAGAATDLTTQAAHVVSSCSGILQHCTQLVGERIAPALTAAIVGTASIGVAAAVEHVPEVEQATATEAASVLERGDPTPTKQPSMKVAAASTPKADDDRTVPSSETNAAPPPTPSATPSPSPSPTPSSNATGGDDTKPSPSPSPTPDEPTGFALSFTTDVPFDGASCSCLWDTAVEHESVTVNQQRLAIYSQRLVGTVTAAGSRSYGLELEHSGSESHQRAEFLLWTPEGSYRYQVSTSDVRRTATEWGGWTYRYTGTYELGGRPSKAERVPERGTYVSEVTVSWRQQKIVDVGFHLVESP